MAERKGNSMAVIDTFLKLMVAQKADRLVVSADEVPILLKGDETIELSMPTVPADIVANFAVEVIGKDQSGELGRGQLLEGIYQDGDGADFAYLVSSGGSGCRIEMHRSGYERPVEDAKVAGAGTDSPAGGGPIRGTGDPPPSPPSLKTRQAEPESGSAPAPRRRRADTDNAATPPDPVILSVVAQALEAGASDIFLSTAKPAQMRLDGTITSLETVITDDAQILQLIPREISRHELDTSGNADFAVEWIVSGRSHRFRINVFHHTHGLAAALRPIRERIPSLHELHLPADLAELCSYSSGLVLLTGASGSGKSTTLAALVEHINQSKARHIITIEDPVEFEHRDDRSLIHQREVGAHVESFSSGLRAALRENPDVILLGEMRDLPTISAALTAAETGHLVLSTLHTGNASAAVNRIIDVYPGHQQAHVRMQLASSLRAVVAQRLVPTADHAGRVPAIEKLIVTPAVAIQIREGREHQVGSAIQTGVEDGMITLERSLASLVQSGKITASTAFLHAEDQAAMRKLIG